MNDNHSRSVSLSNLSIDDVMSRRRFSEKVDENEDSDLNESSNVSSCQSLSNSAREGSNLNVKNNKGKAVLKALSNMGRSLLIVEFFVGLKL